MKKTIDTLLRAFLAGVSIGIGGAVFLSCDNRYVGSFLFAIGLFLIFSYGLNLFTGKVGYALENPPSYILFLFLVWIGNFIGTYFVGFLLRFTRVYPAIGEKAQKLCEAKLADNPLSIFILACFCGLMMYLAADGFKVSENVVRKYLAVFLPVMIFILSGFEHCVANMFYYALSGFYSTKSILYLLLMSLGNAVGSFLFPAVGIALKRCSEKKK